MAILVVLIVVFILISHYPPVRELINKARQHPEQIKTYIQKKEITNLHMHIVTTYFDGKGSITPYGGKGYGKCEYPKNNPTKWRGDEGHRGIDIHAKVGDSIYAVHGGIISNQLFSPSAAKPYDTMWHRGRYVNLNFSSHLISYLHLSKFIESLDKKRVMAGRIIGKAGRTGNFNPDGEYLSSTYQTKWPGHVHLNIQCKGETVGFRNAPDELNKICVPYNEIPLLFPCCCEITLDSESPQNQNCSFNIAKFTKECWAVAELKCPYMNDDYTSEDDVFRVQAQLRYLNEKPSSEEGNFKKNNNPDYLHPGNPNGSWGDKSEAAIKKFRQRHSDEIFGEEAPSENSSTWIELPTAGSYTLQLLNEKAPISKPSNGDD